MLWCTLCEKHYILSYKHSCSEFLNYSLFSFCLDIFPDLYTTGSNSSTNTTSNPLPQPTHSKHIPQKISISNTLIIGSLNAIGYGIATYLKEKNIQVTTTEDYIAPDFDLTHRKQMFLDKFNEKKGDLKVVSYAQHEEVEKIFENKNIKNVLYIPSPSAPKEVDLKDSGIKYFTQLLKNFINLLAFMESERSLTDVRFVLVATEQFGMVQKELQGLFALIVSSYKSTTNLDLLYAQVSQGFGRDHCSNFVDLIGFIYSSEPENIDINDRAQFFRCSEVENSGTFKDVTSVNRTKNVLFSTYFTHNKQFVRPYRENSFQFVKGFVLTAMKYGLQIVIYYDQMDQNFKHRLHGLYNKIEFIHYKGNFHKRTINDARFYIMYEYLLENPEVEMVILQDLRDGIYLEDPFKVMKLMGDFLYAGMDVSFHKNFPTSYKRCESVLKKKFTRKLLYPMMNAGTLGGTRHVVLAFLAQIMKYFDEVFPAHLNCNMDAFDFVAHHVFQDVMFSGYPFQGFMQIGLSSPPGLAVRHKRTKYDM